MSKPKTPPAAGAWRSPLEVIGGLCQLPATASLTNLPCPFHPAEPPGLRCFAADEGPVLLCERCARTWDLPELVAEKVHTDLEYALTLVVAPGTPEELCHAELRWRQQRASFMAHWPELQDDATTFTQTKAELPFGEWGIVNAHAVPAGWASLMSGISRTRKARVSRRLRLALRLLRDGLGRAAGFELYQLHGTRLAKLKDVDFQPKATGARFAFGAPPAAGFQDLIVTYIPGDTGELETARAAWPSAHLELALLVRTGSLQQTPLYLVYLHNFGGPRSLREFYRSELEGPSYYRIDHAGPLNHVTREEFLVGAESLDPEPGPTDDSRHFPFCGERLIIGRGVFAFGSGPGQSPRPAANFSVRIVVERRTSAGTLEHGLDVSFGDESNGTLRFWVPARGFARRLRGALWEACAEAGRPRPHFLDARLWRALPDVVAALSDPPAAVPPAVPPVRQGPEKTLCESFLGALARCPTYDSLVTYRRGYRLIDLSCLNDLLPLCREFNFKEVSHALRATYGPAFGLVRTGKFKKGRALRIP